MAASYQVRAHVLLKSRKEQPIGDTGSGKTRTAGILLRERTLAPRETSESFC